MTIHQPTYNGAENKSVIIKLKIKLLPFADGCFHVPSVSYDGPLPITKAKYEMDLQDLKTLCSEEAQKYFKELPHTFKIILGRCTDYKHSCSSFK